MSAWPVPRDRTSPNGVGPSSAGDQWTRRACSSTPSHGRTSVDSVADTSSAPAALLALSLALGGLRTCRVRRLVTRAKAQPEMPADRCRT